MILAGTFLRRGGFLALALLAAQAALAQTRDQANRAVEARLKKDVTFLASPEYEGRGPTTAGLDRAADYIAEQFRKIGLRPGGKSGYFQPFRVAAAEGSLTLTGPLGQTIQLKQGLQFNPLGYDQNGDVAGGVVFAGY